VPFPVRGDLSIRCGVHHQPVAASARSGAFNLASDVGRQRGSTRRVSEDGERFVVETASLRPGSPPTPLAAYETLVIASPWGRSYACSSPSLAVRDPGSGRLGTAAGRNCRRASGAWGWGRVVFVNAGLPGITAGRTRCGGRCLRELLAMPGRPVMGGSAGGHSPAGAVRAAPARKTSPCGSPPATASLPPTRMGQCDPTRLPKQPRRRCKTAADRQAGDIAGRAREKQRASGASGGGLIWSAGRDQSTFGGMSAPPKL